MTIKSFDGIPQSWIRPLLFPTLSGQWTFNTTTKDDLHKVLCWSFSSNHSTWIQKLQSSLHWQAAGMGHPVAVGPEGGFWHCQQFLAVLKVHQAWVLWKSTSRIYTVPSPTAPTYWKSQLREASSLRFYSKADKMSNEKHNFLESRNYSQIFKDNMNILTHFSLCWFYLDGKDPWTLSLLFTTEKKTVPQMFATFLMVPTRKAAMLTS